MALIISKDQYKSLEAYFTEVYDSATKSQRAIRNLVASFDGTVNVDGVEFTQAQLDAREQKLKDDWTYAKANLISKIDAILGV